MKTRNKTLMISVISLAILVFLSQSVLATHLPKVVEMLARSNTTDALGLIQYSIVVPPKPNVTASSGVEVHVGMQSPDNQSAIKSTIAYGCRIGFTSPCSKGAGWLDRYIAYFTVLNLTNNKRHQYPSTGFLVQVGDIVNFTQQRSSACNGETGASWLLTVNVSNSTSNTSYSTKICGNDPYVQNRNYTQLVSGILEVHEVNTCGELFQSPVTQYNMSFQNVDNQTLTPNWTSEIVVNYVNCNYSHQFVENNVTMLWNNS